MSPRAATAAPVLSTLIRESPEETFARDKNTRRSKPTRTMGYVRSAPALIFNVTGHRLAPGGSLPFWRSATEQ
jgi:hypothetical protein